jgi:7,8-dihydropterin-6-yl-methyl-4-(beta-D-ribofuranosyl)aminobenzene 5'-phosphate synthase
MPMAQAPTLDSRLRRIRYRRFDESPMLFVSNKPPNHKKTSLAMGDEMVQITLLIDNQSPPDLASEHGFSAWIESGDQRILFDTGQGTALDKNARRLGIDLSLTTALVLSHGHYDHTGGVADFLAANARAKIFFGHGLGATRFSCHPDQAPRAIGIGDTVDRALRELPRQRCSEIASPYTLAPSIGISGPIPRLNASEDTGGPFFLDAQQNHPDLINDELAMWFETGKGLLILTGCCHRGLINTVTHIRRISGIERVHAIVGGLHLLNASADRIEQTLRFIADCAPDFLIPCHCTGARIVEQLQLTFGTQRVQAGLAGQRYRLG